MDTAPYTPEDTDRLLTSCIQRIATGPTMSKDLSRDEARAAMGAILDGKVHPVQTAVFLIALRMKRETESELHGILEAIRAATRTATAQVDELVDLADPYDGYLRHVPAAPFLPAVLAACGLPAVSHGVQSMAPKYGITHHMVLAAAGVDVDLTPEEAAARLADPAVSWSYVDQRRHCPALYALLDLRRLIVKRPCITTLETLAGPVRARQRTHIVTGYVHRDYATIYTDLARHAGFYSSLVVRGIEGGVIPLLNKTVDCNSYHDDKADKFIVLDPADAGIFVDERGEAVPKELYEDDHVDVMALTELTARHGIQALEGRPGLTRESLVYAAAACLIHARRHPTWAAAADAARAALDTGRALRHFRA